MKASEIVSIPYRYGTLTNHIILALGYLRNECQFLIGMVLKPTAKPRRSLYEKVSIPYRYGT